MSEGTSLPALQRWAVLEQTIDDAVEAVRMEFVTVGNAILEINSDTVIREEIREQYGSMEKYYERRFGLSRQRVSQMMSAVEVWRSLDGKVGIMPRNEHQVKPLAALPDARTRQRAWKKIVANAPRDDDDRPVISAKLIKEIVDEMLPDDEPAGTPSSNGKPETKAAAPSSTPKPSSSPEVEDEAEGDTEAEVEEEVEAEDEYTAADAMADWNRHVDQWCKELNAIEKKLPAGVWCDELRISAIKSSLKAAKSSLRASKGAGTCPRCEGGGCKPCKQSGFMPKVEYQSHGGK